LALWQQSGSDMYFTAGKVGIGTASPLTKLDLRGGNLNLDYGQYIRVGNQSAPTSEGGDNSWASGTSNLLRAYWNGGQDAVDIYTPGSASASPKLTLLSGGNIGIGTTAPQVKLDVYGTTPQIRALDSGSGVDMRMASSIYVGTGTVGTLSNHPVNMVSNNVVRLFITADGKIGVGNVNPAYQLDVQGSIKTRNGFVFPDNSTQTTASFGTVTTVNTGAGLTGGPITTSGTINLAGSTR